jgi:hypothetical protein
MNTRQQSLFDREQPAAVECCGTELLPLLAELKERGAVPFAMTAICVGRWRLSLDWRNAEKMRFRSTGVQSG